MLRKPVSVISGSAKGIGLATAAALAKRGHHVVVTARDLGAAQSALKGILSKDSDGNMSGTAVSFDVTDQVTVDAAVAQLKDDAAVKRNHGQIDVLINNSGAATAGAAADMDLDVLQQTFDVNVKGVARVTNAFLDMIVPDQLKDADPDQAPIWGRSIICTSSIMGSLAEWSDHNSAFLRNCDVAAYSMSKAALNMYCVILAKELAAKKVAVNAVHPGWIATDLAEALPGKAPNGPEFGAQQILDVVMANRKKMMLTGAFMHQRHALRF